MEEGWPLVLVKDLSAQDILLLRESAFDDSGLLVKSFMDWREELERHADYEARVTLLRLSKANQQYTNFALQDVVDALAAHIRSSYKGRESKPAIDDVPSDILRILGIDTSDPGFGLNFDGFKAAVPAASAAGNDVHATLSNLLSMNPTKAESDRQSRWQEQLNAISFQEAQSIMGDKGDGTLRWLQEKTADAIKHDVIRSRTQALLMVVVTDALEALWDLHIDNRSESDSMFVYDAVESKCGAVGVQVLVDCLDFTQKFITQLAVFKKYVKVDTAGSIASTVSSQSPTQVPRKDAPFLENLGQVREERTVENKLAKLKHKMASHPTLPLVVDSHNFPILVALDVLDFTMRTNQTPQEVAGGAPKKTDAALPEGTVVNKEARYTEYIIPPQSKHFDPNNPDREKTEGEDALIPISSLPDWCQTIMYGIKNLNRIQSAVFEAAFEGDENLLICAPTGAGKTNVALLTIMQALRPYLAFQGRTPASHEFKVVYVAPLKSLVTEIANKFADRLGPMGLKVAEFTGDMPLTKPELDMVHVVVTVPEKWDIQTRNAKDAALGPLKLLIIDEVHLVGEDRGSILEATVARSFSYMSDAQKRHRIVALSATLPNYNDVALFLEVKRENVFVFGDGYRPIPLRQTIMGLIARNVREYNDLLVEETYNKIVPTLKNDKQCMVFVHSRNETLKTANALLLKAQKAGTNSLFTSRVKDGSFMKDIKKCQHEQLRALLVNGIGIHHAGLSRPDRRLVETLFHKGALSVLCSTATLAWGVNLPAHQVIIKGTQIFGENKDLGILDVLQIFGRAGRPDFDILGDAVLITEINKLDFYLKQLLRQTPLESSLEKSVADHLNAEIVLGNIPDMRAAAQWIRHTFLFVRMRRNPIHYGITTNQFNRDSTLYESRMLLVQKATTMLYQQHLIRRSVAGPSSTLSATGLGRVAAKYYVHHNTIDAFNKALSTGLVDDPSPHRILLLVAGADEFESLRVRDEEIEELTVYKQKAPIAINTSVDEVKTKVALLVLMWLEERWPTSFSLGTDLNFVTQSYGRLLRAFTEICFIRQMGTSQVALAALTWSNALHTRVLPTENVLAHFIKSNDRTRKSKKDALVVSPRAVSHLAGYAFEDLLALSVSELSYLTRTPADGRASFELARKIPNFEIDCKIVPVTFAIVSITLRLVPIFEWNPRYHGKGESFRIILVNPVTKDILHAEDLLLKHENVAIIPRNLIPGRNRGGNKTGGDGLGVGSTYGSDRERIFEDLGITIKFNVPLRDPRPPQYMLHVVSDKWVNVSCTVVFQLDNMLMPNYNQLHTDLLPLSPIHKSALNNSRYESLYRFSFFNPIQSQVFYCMYHTGQNSLVGAPTGAGKTICGELALLRLFNTQPKRKCIYIAPLKALGKERLKDWTVRMSNIGKLVVELSGDLTPDLAELKRADVIITTPEKWDGISRHWQHRDYVREVGLMIVDEIHLLGADRGPILEMIVSRMRHISILCHDIETRFVGLSTALANAVDIARWIGVNKRAVFNFRPCVRPVPCSIFVKGFSEAAYCKRMGTMNKPAFAAILEHSIDKPVLVFVSSRRQVRITGKELLWLSRTHDPPLSFLHCPEEDQAVYENRVEQQAEDEDLVECLKGGVGLHHAGLSVSDRQLSERLFLEGKVQVLVATSTLAWGVNLPARLVILKGTEYYDGATRKYVDIAITEVLQMIGRAGRPQFDTEASACVFLCENKKQYYRRFLYEPFPVESSLHEHLTEHLNAEIVSGTIRSKRDAIEFLSWTYFFRRVLNNVSYYDEELCADMTLFDEGDSKADVQRMLKEQIARYIDRVISRTVLRLQDAGCVQITINDDDRDLDLIDRVDIPFCDRVRLAPTGLGRICSLYYISHATVALLAKRFSENKVFNFYTVIRLLCDCVEMSYVPVRHSEDESNLMWHRSTLLLPLDVSRITKGGEKALALFQMIMWRLKPPVHDYWVDSMSMVAACMRLIQAMADICREVGCLSGWRSLLLFLQCVSQSTNPFRSDLYCLPHVTKFRHHKALVAADASTIAQVLYGDRRKIRDSLLAAGWANAQWAEFDQVVRMLPRPKLEVSLWRRAGEEEEEEWEPVERLEEEGVEEEGVRFAVCAADVLQLRISRSNHRGWACEGEPPAEPVDPDLAYTPRWPRRRVLTWWYGLGDVAADELVDFVKTRSGRTSLTFSLPAGRRTALDLSLWVGPDCYVGLTQTVKIKFLL